MALEYFRCIDNYASFHVLIPVTVFRKMLMFYVLSVEKWLKNVKYNFVRTGYHIYRQPQ